MLEKNQGQKRPEQLIKSSSSDFFVAWCWQVDTPLAWASLQTIAYLSYLRILLYTSIQVWHICPEGMRLPCIKISSQHGQHFPGTSLPALPVCQAPATWLGASSHLILTSSSQGCSNLSPIVQTGDRLGASGKASHLKSPGQCGSITPYTSRSFSSFKNNKNSKVKNPRFHISGRPKSCF